MGCKKKYLILPAVLVCCLVAHVAAVPLTDLFPFGLKFGDDSLPPGDDTSATVTLQQHFPFYGKSRHSITVRTDGRLELRADEDSTANIFSYSANVDTTNIGEIFYRETNDPFLLKKAAAMMLSGFPELFDATPTSLFITTWFYVGYFDGHSDKTNTFQCVLATNGTVGFVTFLYVDGHMQWTATDSGRTVVVGFPDDSTYLFPPTDLTDIDTKGNAGSPGKWLFRVDEQSITIPDAAAVRSALEVEERDRRFVSGEGPDIDLQTGEVSIGFQEMSLTVAEDELSIQVCVVIDAQQSVGDITIEFQLITQDDTATAPDDYIGINETIAINASTVHVVCRNITILEDKRFEYQEIFLVELCPLPDQNENLRYTITRLFIFINDTTVFIEGCDFLTFIDLDTPVPVPLSADGSSDQVEIDVRFPLGLPPNIVEEQPLFRIAENGAITFDGDSWSFNQPRVFPNTLLTIRDRYVLAPFWADHDLQTSGSVEYQIFQRQIDSSDNETLLNVSIFIRKQFPDASDYLGIWMLVVNWIAIPPCGDPTSTNTYQAIAITDGINSYAIYTYRCDLMEWSGGAVVGFNAFGQTYGNHLPSGRPTVHTDTACANLHGDRGVSYANVFFHVGRSENPTQFDRVRCLEIYENDMRFPPLSTVAPTPCPCTFSQAVADNAFQHFPNDTTDDQVCFIPVFAAADGRSVECCYYSVDETLITTGRRASSVLRFHPTSFPEQYALYDLEFRDVCCGPAGLCDILHMHRPLEDCSTYVPPFGANNPPILLGESPFIATPDVQEVYRFTATDSDNFTVTVADGVITNNGILERNGTEFTFTFTIPSASDNFVDFALEFNAVDSEGAPSSLQPQLQICACVNGNCTLDGVDDTAANTIVLNCDCPEAYTGKFCGLEADACDRFPCFRDVECTDIPAPGEGANCGPCPDGFRELGQKCLDIDECNQTSGNPCDQICVNTVGSFVCSCMSGFMLAPDNRNCIDVDECMQALNPCDQICINTVGSFECMCEDDFMFAPDNFTCEGPPCDANISPCSDRCVNISGSVSCLCFSGRSLSPDDVTCEDINECMLTPPVCEQTCADRRRRFVCGCLSGFDLQSDGRSCSDIDECLLMGASACGIAGQICVNTEGSFTCTCPPGSAFVDGACQVANVMFLETEFTVAESDRFFNVCVSITGGLSESAIVGLATVASSATAGSDYVPIFASESLVFMTSPSQICTNIGLIEDMIVEETEQFHLTLTSALLGTNLVMSESRATVFLIDSSVVTIGFLEPSYTIDECDGCPVVVRIGMSGSVLETNVFFTLSTQDDTAIENVDYVPANQMLQFGPTLPSEIEFEITILSDDITEEEEQFIALLESNDSSVMISTSSATITIVDRSVVTAEFEPCRYSVNESSLNVSVCVRLSGQRARNHVVRLQTNDVTAEAPEDYSAINSDLEFSPGLDLRCTDIEIVADFLIEPLELFVVMLSSSDESVIVNSSKNLAIVEILDTSDPILIEFQRPSYTVSEAMPSVTIAVDVSGLPPIVVEISFSLSTVDVSAEAGLDYNATTVGASLSSDGSFNLTVPIINDMLLEDLIEEFEIDVDGVSVTIEPNARAPGVTIEIPQESVSVFIIDDDGASVALDQTSLSITEPEARRNLAIIVCVTLTGNTAVDVSVVLSTESGTAEEGEDFNGASNVLTFPPVSGSRTDCSAFSIIDDEVKEDDENFTISLNSTDRRISITVDEATVTIFGDDDTVSVGFAETAFTANENEGVVTVLINITGEAECNFFISISTKNGSAIAGEDYDAIYSQTIELTPESLEQQLQVNITLIDNDILEQMLETFTVCLDTTDSGVTLTSDTTTVTIVEDDGPVVRFTQEVYNGTEGGTATVCLSLNGQADFDITVTLTSMDGNALAGLDYGEINETLTFVAGEVLVCQNITLLTDDMLEVTESFSVFLSSHLPEVMIPFPNATVDILDANFVDISFLQAVFVVNEDSVDVNSGSVMVCVDDTVPPQFDRDVIVTVTTRNGSAQAPNDFEAFTEILTFRGTTVLFCVNIDSNFPLVNDDDAEGDEDFFLDITSDDPAFQSSVPTAQIVILDDDSTCGRPPNECDINAACRPNAFGILECMCNQGFIGDGFNCQVILPIITFVNNTPHVDNVTLTLTVLFYENEGVQSSICQLGPRPAEDCTGGFFFDPSLPLNKATPFVLRIISTAFDGVTTTQTNRNINVGGRSTCSITVINDGQLQAIYTSLNTFVVEWEGTGPVEAFTCTLTETVSGNTTSSSCFSPFVSGVLADGNYTLAIQATGSTCRRQNTHTIRSLIVPDPNPHNTACSGHPTTVCDDNAECRPTSSGTLQCMCNQGFTGNGFNCEVIMPVITFFNNTPHVDNVTLTLTVQFHENEGVQSSICQLGPRPAENCTGGFFFDPSLPQNKVTPFVLRITSTAFDGVTTALVSRNINIGGRSTCSITVINDGQLQATYISLNTFMVEWEGTGPVEAFTCTLTETISGTTTSSSCLSPFMSGVLADGDYTLAIQATGSTCRRENTHTITSLIVPNSNP